VWASRVRLTDFRSYADVDITLTPGVTTFLGQNGQGKTNLVEAISYASVLGSHRVASDAPLVRSGADRAVIGVEVVRDDRTVLVELEINPGKANRARINRSPTPRARDVLGLVRTVMFAPEDLALVKGDPGDRRRLLDDLLLQRSPRMLGVKADYDRILKQRNALLKSASIARRASSEGVTRTLEVWDEQLAGTGGELIAARVALIEDLRPHLAEAYALIAGGGDAVSSADVTIDYHSSLGPGVDMTTDRAAWREAMLAGIESRRRDELDRGITLVGPHRDDMHIQLGGLPAKGYASHGESWSIALSLRLAGLEVLRADGDDPILILDDVFAELDAPRRRRLTERVSTGAQVLITAAVGEDVPLELRGRRLLVTKGAIDDA
jgi:DNA replication and repair protein RecF